MWSYALGSQVATHAEGVGSETKVWVVSRILGMGEADVGFRN